jgi:hypothetical protein
MLSTQSHTVLGILLYTSVRTTGPTSNRSATASNDSCGVSKSAINDNLQETELWF